MMTRRGFLQAAGAGPLAQRMRPGLKLGVMDGVLRLSSKPEAVALARKFGFEGVQVTLGRTADGKGMLLEDHALQEQWVAASRQHGVPLDATYVDILHVNCLKNNEAARDLVARGIDATRRLNARILMTVFFGKCSVLNRQELNYVTDVFRELSREAERAGVILGFENLLNADDNLYAFDRVRSRAFQIYYDVGNTTNRVGVNAPAEIRRLGRERICQFHFKDEGYLGEGKVDFPSVLQAIEDIGFDGYANLETNSPSGDMEKDLRRNIQFLRETMRQSFPA